MTAFYPTTHEARRHARFAAPKNLDDAFMMIKALRVDLWTSEETIQTLRSAIDEALRAIQTPDKSWEAFAVLARAEELTRTQIAPDTRDLVLRACEYALNRCEDNRAQLCAAALRFVGVDHD